MPEERLYIKVILPKQANDVKVKGRSGPIKPFKKLSGHFKAYLSGQLSQTMKRLDLLPPDSQIVPILVDLEKKAEAKSHRPDKLFNQRTCPIIGAGKPGRLFIKGTKKGVRAITRKIESQILTPRLEKDISTIRNMQPVGPSERLGEKSPEAVFAEAPKAGNNALLKVSLFNYGDDQENVVKRKTFENQLASQHIECRRIPHFTEQEIYAVTCSSPEVVRSLSDMVMVRSVCHAPTLRSLVTKQFNFRQLPDTLFGVGSTPHDYPIVAVVDSGVTSDNPLLNQWIFARERFVASKEENTGHGTFVAGLLIWSHVLNNHPEIGEHPTRILDVHVLPNSDPTYGRIGHLGEAEFLESLETCLKKYANQVKVWNLSLGSDAICRLDHFSDFAIELDNLQEKYAVSFVIAAGNYGSPPLLSYPRSDKEKDKGRITTPADSVLGITVASISQMDHPSGSSVKRGEPSPFSCNGPGPNYIIKPDLAHFGGNIKLDAKEALGLTSLSPGQRVSQDIGTSFATPLISRQLASIYHSIMPSPSPTLARALLTHNARDIRNRERVADGDDHYIGFGTPLTVDHLLECTPWMTTLVFDEQLRPGYVLEWDDFPYPQSLHSNDKYRGEIWMTLAYPPKRDPAWGSEYCETHVDASFGIYHDGPKQRYAGECPPEHVNKGQLYESFQVKNLRKWAPVRTYHRMITRGITGYGWRLSVKLLCRHDVEAPGMSSQPFTLILTIADPERQAPVYNEMAQILRTRYQTQNLMVRPTVRVTANV